MCGTTREWCVVTQQRKSKLYQAQQRRIVLIQWHHCEGGETGDIDRGSSIIRLIEKEVDI